MSLFSDYASPEYPYAGDVLANAIGYTPAELALNRRGCIPAHQAQRVWVRASGRFAVTASVFAVLAVVSIVLALVSAGVWSTDVVFGLFRWLGFEPSVLYIPLAAVIISVVAVGVGIELWFATARLMALRRDLRTGHAAIVVGWPRFSSELIMGFSLTAGCWLVVNNLYLEVTAEVPMELSTDRPCRVYYTPESRMVLSVEPV